MEQYRQSLVAVSEALNNLSCAEGCEMEAAMRQVATAQIGLNHAKTALLALD
jgi:hypothetical protein